MPDSSNERANRQEAARLLAEARAAHRDAERERARARKLASRIARRMQHTLNTARTQLDADRASLEARIARFNDAQSLFHSASATDREHMRNAWADFAARQTRLAEEWDEANRYHAEQAATLAAREHELTQREKREADTKAKLQTEVAALREEAAALEARIRNARQVVDELERQREQLRAEALAPAANTGEPPMELQVALDRTADRDLTRWANELAQKEDRLHTERAAITAIFANATRDKAALADQRRVLTEQFTQLAVARAKWQEAERATVAEIEQLAITLRRREAELDAREQRLSRADSRRREDAYELWQMRLRLEAWQTKLVAYEMQWFTEREQLEAEFAAREHALRAGSDDTVPTAMIVREPAIPAELAALREEVERLATVMMEMELPESLDLRDSELPWGTVVVEDALPATDTSDPETSILAFDQTPRAA
jgi:chromosome segregation ATPase